MEIIIIISNNNNNDIINNFESNAMFMVNLPNCLTKSTQTRYVYILYLTY